MMIRPWVVERRSEAIEARLGGDFAHASGTMRLAVVGRVLGTGTWAADTVDNRAVGVDTGPEGAVASR